VSALPPEPIVTPRVVLRPFTEEDIPALVVAADEPLNARFLQNMPSPYRLEDAAWWVAVGAPAAWAAGGAQFALADPASDAVIGAIGLNSLGKDRRAAEVGYWVAAPARGRGVATAAVRALAAWGFEHGFARVELLADAENPASQRVALACGFSYEGVRRGLDSGRHGGRRDLLAFARLADDPPGPTTRPLPDLPGGELTDGVVTLRRLAPADLDDAYAHRVDPDVVATSVPPVVPRRADVARRCSRAESAWLLGERADLTIRDARDDRYAGDIGLFYQEPRTGQALIGYGLLPAYRGRGLATRAVRLVSRWAFDIGIPRLIAGTAPENVASQRVLTRAGFRREGYQRSRLPGPGGARIDDVLFALLPDDPAG
jgi:RimJ/RimL family protein N-acetyltransferase